MPSARVAAIMRRRLIGGEWGVRGYRNLQEHLAALDEAGLLVTVDVPVDKDSELVPLVRWQFRGGIAEADRRAFLFTDVVDARGRRYDMPVAVGALAASPAVYAVGMRRPVEEIGECWRRAVACPVDPVEVSRAACQEVVFEGGALSRGGGLDALPVPVSTPGYDAAPYLTATACVTRDPDSGVQNIGTYRGGLKAPDRIGLKLFMDLGQGAAAHWRKCRGRGVPMPMAFVVGCPPPVAYVGPQKLAPDTDEIGVAGGLAGAPIEVVRARTVDLMVPAEAEVVVEGLVDTAELEPEGPFGESHGHVNLEEYNLVFRVTAVTRRRDAVLASIISQVTPSESSVIKRVAYEPLFLEHLASRLGIAGVRRVAMHEPLTNLRKLVVLQFAAGVPRTEIWRALHGALSFQAPVGKFLVAVGEDIDPDNLDAVFWAMSYRANLAEDCELAARQPPGHGPRTAAREDAALLVDATLKAPMAPVALPAREHMERARALWERLGLPPLSPEPPWHGYELGDWSGPWAEAARRAARGEWMANGERTARLRRSDVEPNQGFREGG